MFSFASCICTYTGRSCLICCCSYYLPALHMVLPRFDYLHSRQETKNTSFHHTAQVSL